MTTKIKQIEVSNLKAIGQFTGTFEGLSAMITGRNNSGKSTLLRSIIDRIRGIRPSIVLKENETEGKGTIELTSGEKFIWEFNNEGRDTLIFVTKDGYKTAVTKEISKKFFKPLFDIDEFLKSGPKEQTKQLQKLIGVDFTDVDFRYKLSYDDRTLKNKDVETEKAKLREYKTIPEKVEEVSVSELIETKNKIKEKLKQQGEKNKIHNKGLKLKWEEMVANKKAEIEDFNKIQVARQIDINDAETAKEMLVLLGCKLPLKEFVQSLPQPLPQRAYESEPIAEPMYIEEMPDDKEEKAIDEKINNASEVNKQAESYKTYHKQIEALNKAKGIANVANDKVKEIEAEKQKMITDAKMPKGFTITEDGIMVDGYPLDKNQLSSSKLYCAALRLAAMNLGDVKTLHFDASTLDRNSLLEIEKWAKDNDLQLLIERPDFDGGEIKYELIEKQ